MPDFYGTKNGKKLWKPNPLKTDGQQGNDPQVLPPMHTMQHAEQGMQSYGQPPMGMPPYGQPPMGMNPYGQPPMGMPPYYGQPPVAYVQPLIVVPYSAPPQTGVPDYGMQAGQYGGYEYDDLD